MASPKPTGKGIELKHSDGKVSSGFPAKWQEHECWLYMFGAEPHGEKKLEFFRRYIELQWPEPAFQWDEWCDLFFGALCGAGETIERITGRKMPEGKKWWRTATSTGAAATGKSAKAALWILTNWLCGQVGTSCILTSTSVGMLKKRIWADICEWIGKAKYPLPLTIIPSDMEIRVRQGDSKNAIFGIAVQAGGVPQEAVDRIKGIHNRRVFVVVDEMTAVAPAIVHACSNLNKGTIEFQFIGLGNALPGENPHTVHCEPEDGWNSVTVDDAAWATRKGGVCLHFDGHKSPALRDPARYHYYIKKEELDADKVQFGGENTPEYWTNDRGFWPPSGLSNTVMDLALLNQFEVEKSAVWKAGYEMAAAFDPAFEGGDRRVLYPFKWGEFSSGVTGIEFQKPIIVGVDSSTDKRNIHYAIATAVEDICANYECDGKKQPIKPENFIMDTTGEGGGLFNIISGRWGQVDTVEFGAGADKVQMYPDRPTTWAETYANKVTMIWYVFRRYVEGGQIRGLTDTDARNELANREKKIRGGKTALVSKSDMKLLKRSCDIADAAVCAAEFLRRKGIAFAGSTGGVQKFNMEAWNKMASKLNMTEEYEAA